jgi:hypothetical protein
MEFKWSESDIITGDKYLSLQSDTIAYIKTDALFYDRPIEWRGEEHTLRAASIWITGHSDFPITKEVFDTHKNKTCVWFATNMGHVNPKLTGLPIGITNNTKESTDHVVFGNTCIMQEVSERPRTINNLVYMNFLISTYPLERQVCYDTFVGKPWVTVGQSEKTLEARKNLLIDIRNHMFVLCPRGNGVDTHRLWETLYMGSIPIVKRDVAFNDVLDLPILFVNEWTEITEDFLLAEYERIATTKWNMKKLSFSYWKERILQAESEVALHSNRVTIQV